MAEALIKTKLSFLKQYSKLLAAFLGLLGILPSCDYATGDSATYGPPALQFSGHIYSAVDSTWLNDIRVKVLSIDLQTEYSSVFVFNSNAYWFDMPPDIIWPGSLRLIASDEDSLGEGWFADKDTILTVSDLEEELLDPYFVLDLYLDPVETGL